MLKSSISYEKAKMIMGNNLVGLDDLKNMAELELDIPIDAYEIPFDESTLREKSEDYFLIYGASRFCNGDPVNIKNLKKIFGDNPNIKSPCFYFQDWYDKESFIKVPLEDGWFFIRKKVFNDSRACSPDELQEKYVFPSAIKCTYSFFVVWLSKNEKLWYHDFVWCSDEDHNGDRIYVGRYKDIDDVNKDGFNIHRHLKIKECYACID